MYVHNVPVEYHKRHGGRSKVRHVRDTLRAFQIIIETILRYNPIKAFSALGYALCGHGGTANSGWDFWLVVAVGDRGSDGWLRAGGILGLGFLAVVVRPERYAVFLSSTIDGDEWLFTPHRQQTFHRYPITIPGTRQTIDGRMGTATLRPS